MPKVPSTMRFTSVVHIILAVANLNSAFYLQNSDSLSPHIIGGFEVKPHSHPHQVLLNVHKTDILQKDAQCGGSLISSEWIISAAHCNDNAIYIFAILGAHDRCKYESSQQMKIISQFIKHPDYNSENFDNDIALLKFEPPVTFRDEIKPIRLPSWSQKDDWFWRYPVITTGWGLNSYDSDNHSTTLQAIMSITITNFYCGFRLGFGTIKDVHICIDGVEGKAAYKGDSGGPLVINDSDGEHTLIGVTSIVREKSYPTVFTRITYYLNWISKTTGLSIRK